MALRYDRIKIRPPYNFLNAVISISVNFPNAIMSISVHFLKTITLISNAFALGQLGRTHPNDLRRARRSVFILDVMGYYPRWAFNIYFFSRGVNVTQFIGVRSTPILYYPIGRNKPHFMATITSIFSARWTRRLQKASKKVTIR